MSKKTIHQRLCGVEGCDRKYSCGGLCSAHYLRKWHEKPFYKLIGEKYPRQIVFCDANDCKRIGGSKSGLCTKHYQRKKRNGTFKTENNFLSFSRIEELRSVLLKNRNITKSGCWEWTKGRQGGYGVLWVDGRNYRVNRISAWLYKGLDIKGKLLSCHSCDNPPCFNPEHLFIGTTLENRRDCIKKNRNRKGELCWNAKLNESKIKEIRQFLIHGMTQTAISKIYGVSQTLIGCIKRRKTWKHVSE